VTAVRNTQAKLLRAVGEGEAEHALLEALAMAPPFGALSWPGAARGLFRVLDVDASGHLDAAEVLALAPWIAPGCAAARRSKR
jgi:regulator of protease activity HflC (stomatin/prohibitin superfamily)